MGATAVQDPKEAGCRSVPRGQGLWQPWPLRKCGGLSRGPQRTPGTSDWDLIWEKVSAGVV